MRFAFAFGLLLLAGCTGAGSSAPPPVAVGQKYRFRLVSPGAAQVLEVAEVSSESVDYAVHAFVADAPVGEHPARALSLGFSLLGAAAAGPTETLTLAGRSFTCQVTEDGDSRVYTAVREGRPRFPGVVRITRGEQVVFELVAIE